ncbi:tyrosine-type recombinase/integrase [Stenotrophomonas indicatrix]|uniref:tyrosine-type recombinase/integrase n=1 Tax=Stenotrophomonas indicatrix TaxID=2045451 RepID=UPI0015DFE259|nr:tyrosine-type recombinase/integrase [Stenotrophomonas indicatrix]
MRLLFSTKDLKCAGHSLEGFPLLLNRQMELVRPAFDFLYEARTERGLATSTINTYAWALYDFFSWLEDRGLDWKKYWVSLSPRTSIVTAYRIWQNQLRVHRGSPSESTVAQYVKSVQRFYAWALRNSLLNTEAISRTTMPSGKRIAAGVETRTYRTRGLPKPLSLKQIETIISACTDEQTKLIMLLALSTGLRRSELVSLPRSLITDPVSDKIEALQRVPVDLVPRRSRCGTYLLMRTKGHRRRRIFVPARIMRLLYVYVTTGEGSIRGKIHKKRFGTDSELAFLSSHGCPLADSHINWLCKKIGKLSGIDIHPHQLRHTFATHELRQESLRRSTPDALIWLRDRLGHSYLSTTSIYLSLLMETEEAALTEYQSLLVNAAEGST